MFYNLPVWLFTYLFVAVKAGPLYLMAEGSQTASLNQRFLFCRGSMRSPQTDSGVYKLVEIICRIQWVCMFVHFHDVLDFLKI